MKLKDALEVGTKVIIKYNYFDQGTLHTMVGIRKTESGEAYYTKKDGAKRAQFFCRIDSMPQLIKSGVVKIV